MTSTPATILASEMRLMDSTTTGRTYRISVSLPLAYHKPRVAGFPFDNAPDKWHTVYLLDANWFFGMVTDMVRSMAWCGRTSDAIIVGIGYPEDDDPQEAWRDAIARRNLELLPVRDEEQEKRMEEVAKRPVRTGDAPNFHRFIKQELIPFIEQEYRADPAKRVLAGHSRGANFAAFALFEQPDLFNTYIMASSGASDVDRYIYKHEAAYASSHDNLPAKVYLSAGSLEEEAENTTLTDTLRLAAILEGRGYEGLSLVKQVFQDLNHCEVIAPSLQAGLKFALQK